MKFYRKMTLIQVIYDHQSSSFQAIDPIKVLYIKSKEELIPNGNYYICLRIGGQMISFTNQFKKVIIDETENGQFYEIDMFAQKWTIPMNLMHPISLTGLRDPWIENGEIKSKQTDQLTDIFYEKDDQFIAPEFGRDIPIIYNDSELAKKIRSTYPEISRCKQIYGKDVDNVFRYLSDGTSALVFTFQYDSFIDYQI